MWIKFIRLNPLLRLHRSSQLRAQIAGIYIIKWGQKQFKHFINHETSCLRHFLILHRFMSSARFADSRASLYSLNGRLLQASKYLIGLEPVYWIKQNLLSKLSRKRNKTRRVEEFYWNRNFATGDEVSCQEVESGINKNLVGIKDITAMASCCEVLLISYLISRVASRTNFITWVAYKRDINLSIDWRYQTLRVP